MLAQEDAGEDTSAGLPQPYADYLIASSTLSPDKKFAVIYPKTDLCSDDDPAKNPRCQDYLVALEPFAILTQLETEYPHFQNKNHGGISATWSADGTAALVTLDSKWGPADVFLYEIENGKLSRSTSLLPKVNQLFAPDYKAAKIGPVTDEFAFLIESPDEGAFAEFADPGHIRIHALATTDPKQTPGRKAWEASLTAVWDIAQARFTSEKVKRTFLGIHKDENQPAPIA